MTAHAMILHLFGLLLLQSADAGLMLEVNPAQIDIGLSESLDVNCTFTYDGISNMASILSLILSRAGNINQTFVELATITVFAGHTVNLLVQDGATADGYLNPGGESYLHFHWEYPIQQQTGLYECSVQGLDYLGHNRVLLNTTQVTSNPPSLGMLVSEVIKIRKHVKDLESNYLSLNNYTHTLEQTVSGLDIYTAQLQQTITNMDVFTKALEQKVSIMDTYTKMLEEKMSAMDAFTKVLEQEISSLGSERLNRMSDLFEFPPLEYNNRTYYISQDGFYSIEAAMAMCHVYGGYLVEIDDENEYRAVQGYLQSVTDFTLLSIAGTDKSNDGHWVLQSTNKDAPFLDWYQPGADVGTKHDCLCMTRTVSWRMDDYSCHYDTPMAARRYMCEVVIS